jgi:hypothetical protein
MRMSRRSPYREPAKPPEVVADVRVRPPPAEEVDVPSVVLESSVPDAAFDTAEVPTSGESDAGWPSWRFLALSLGAVITPLLLPLAFRALTPERLAAGVLSPAEGTTLDDVLERHDMETLWAGQRARERFARAQGAIARPLVARNMTSLNAFLSLPPPCSEQRVSRFAERHEVDLLRLGFVRVDCVGGGTLYCALSFPGKRSARCTGATIAQ